MGNLEAFAFTTGGNPNHAHLLAAKNLGCHLVRVYFSGFASSFEKAARLDDLIGIREILEGEQTSELLPACSTQEETSEASKNLYLKKMFKKALAEELEVSELWDILVLSEGLFDLIYLLPSTYSPEDIKELINRAYQKAIRKIVDQRLFPLLKGDFDNIGEGLFQDKGEELKEQLRAIPLTIGIETVQTKEPDAQCNFGAWMKGFGEKLRGAFCSVYEKANTIWPWIREMGQDNDIHSLMKLMHKSRSSEAEEVCDVCGSNHIFPEFNRLVPTHKILQKVVRSYRDRFEQICLSCIAIRAVSHGKILVPALRRIISRKDSKILVKKAKGFPDIPPLMRRMGDLEEEEGYVDLEAAFVRKAKSSQKKDDDDLDIFPTISYAADENSNVALIEINPLPDTILKKYELRPALDLDLFCIIDPIKKLKDKFSSGSVKNVLNKSIGPIQGCLGRLDVEQDALSDILSHIKNLVNNETIKELMELFSEIEDKLDYWVEDPRSIPLFNALGILKQLSTPDFIASLIKKEQIKSIVDDLQALQKDDKLFAPFFAEDKDLQRFETFYRELLLNGKVGKGTEVVEPHIARVLQRISHIQSFFDGLSDAFEKPDSSLDIKGIRILSIQTKYPNVLFAIPADRIPDAIKIIHWSLSTNLFSSTLYDHDASEAQRTGSLLLLDAVLPKLLYTSVVIFKHKQPLYMVMAASKKVINRLKELDQKGDHKWNGMLFGFSDQRGTVSDRGLVQAKAPFIDIYTMGNLAKRVDRASVISTATLRRSNLELAMARLYLRGAKQGWDEKTKKGIQKEEFFNPVVYLKRIGRI